jgi:Flp pilus assembly pilin Flp
MRESFDNLVARPADEDGQDLLEYAILAALISVVIIVVLIFVGSSLVSLFRDIINALTSTGA